MKTIKLIDIYIQAILIVIFVVLSLIKKTDTFLIGYFAVGIVQLISALVHILLRWKVQNSPRYLYSYGILLLIIISCLCVIIPNILFIVAYLLLFLAPILALIYVAICMYEIKLMNQRPLALLK